MEEYEVVGWLGSVNSLPNGSQYDDYVILQPNGAGEVGVTGADADIEAEIVALCDRQEPGKYAHFWGKLTCGVPDYNGCQLVVTQLRHGTMQPIESGPVAGWQGIVAGNPEGAQFDDYFVLAGAFPVAFGIEGYGDDGVSADIHARLEQLRDTGVGLRVWGNLVAGIPDAFGSQIMVTRLEVEGTLTEPTGVVEEPVEGWVGTVVGNPEGAQFDDYFQMLDQDGTRHGIDSQDDSIGQQLVALRDTGRLVRVWGVLRRGVPDAYEAQIEVRRIEDFD